MKPIFYDWGGLNGWLFYLVNGLHNGFSDRAMLLGTWLGGHTNFALYLALLSLVAVIRVARAQARRALHADDQRREALRWLSVIAVFSAGYLIDGWLIGWLKPWLDFPRPATVLSQGSVHVAGPPELRQSMPSGHASFAMLVAASCWPILSRNYRIAAVVFVLWIGISRISVGAHFPADVVAGYAKSLAVVLALHAGIGFVVRRSAAGGLSPRLQEPALRAASAGRTPSRRR